jgi:4'-phosphopantetheinyl transferase
MAMDYAQWTVPDNPLQSPAENEVHVWRVEHNAEKPNAQKWRNVLAEEERKHADRFCFEADRHSYTVTRGILRTLLGKYLQLAPKALILTAGRFGKPGLSESQNEKRIAFNVSHSGHYSLLVFGIDVQLGVDVEHVRTRNNIVEVAKTIFSQGEYANFMSLSDLDRDRAFFRAWTRKEAFVKGIGEGLSIPLDHVEIDGTDEWSLHDICVHDDYAAALAVKAKNIDLRLWDFQLTPEISLPTFS